MPLPGPFLGPPDSVRAVLPYLRPRTECGGAIGKCPLRVHGAAAQNRSSEIRMTRAGNRDWTINVVNVFACI